MNYYAIIQNDKIIGKGQCPSTSDDIFSVEITQEIYDDLDRYIYDNGEIVINPNYEQEQAAKERERINMLYLTAADVERAIYKDKGIDFEDILTLLDNYPQIDKKAVKIEFKANNFYRGNPYVNQIGQLIGYTSEQLDYLFEHGSFDEI